MSTDYVHTGHPMGKKAKALQEVVDSAAGAITEQFERRIAALEAHITDLEDRLNERGVFSGDRTCDRSRGIHVTAPRADGRCECGTFYLGRDLHARNVGY